MALVASLLFILLVAPAALAVDHTVGGSSQWSLSADYTTWAAGEVFTVGDTLKFQYDSSHSVAEVSQTDYNNCNSGSPIKSYTSGSDTVTLDKAGTFYFICPTAGHCQGGMKVAVSVAAASGGSPPSGSPPTTPSPTGSPPATPTPSPPTTTTPPPPPPSDSGATRSGGLLLGLSLIAVAVVGHLG